MSGIGGRAPGEWNIHPRPDLTLPSQTEHDLHFAIFLACVQFVHPYRELLTALTFYLGAPLLSFTGGLTSVPQPTAVHLWSQPRLQNRNVEGAYAVGGDYLFVNGYAERDQLVLVSTALFFHYCGTPNYTPFLCNYTTLDRWNVFDSFHTFGTHNLGYHSINLNLPMHVTPFLSSQIYFDPVHPFSSWTSPGGFILYKWCFHFLTYSCLPPFSLRSQNFLVSSSALSSS